MKSRNAAAPITSDVAEVGSVGGGTGSVVYTLN
jgi:L-aminopeptidase/D-esterase-like protein